MDVVYSAEPALQMDVACPRSSFDSFRSSWISDTADGARSAEGARAASSFSSDMSLGSLSGLPSLGSDFFGGDSGAGMAELVETRQRPPSPAPPPDAPAATAAAGPGASVIHCYEAALQVANGFPTPPCEPSTLRAHTVRAQLNAAAPEVPPPQMMMRGQHKADGIPAAFQTAALPTAPAATQMPVSTAAAPHGCHPVAAKAFAAHCVLRPGTHPARELHKIPTPAELEQSILAIRLRIEQAAKQQSQSVCHRGQKGKGSHSIEQLMMQLKILSRDYFSKLCAYIESVNKIVAEHQRLISQRNDILPVTDGALNAKLMAPTRQCQEVVTKALAHLEKDAQQLLQEFCSQHLKKKEKLPDRSTEVLREWLGEHFQHPYPTSQEKRALMTQTGLSLKQINQWFINARVRVWRPAVALMMTESSQLS